jgi:SAM-dependent methyltransferase
MDQKAYWEREALAKRRSPDHPVIAAYVLPKIDVVRRYVELTPQTRLLDVGCGDGFFMFYFDRICDAYGVDYSERLLRKNPSRKTFRMDAHSLDFEDNSFDVVFCHSLLHHVEDPDRVVREMVRVSRKHVVILEPNRNNPVIFLHSLLVREERKGLTFSVAYLQRMAGGNGLRVLASFSYGSVVPIRTLELALSAVAPLTRLLSFKHPAGMTNFLMAEKNTRHHFSDKNGRGRDSVADCCHAPLELLCGHGLSPKGAQ